MKNDFSPSSPTDLGIIVKDAPIRRNDLHTEQSVISDD